MSASAKTLLVILEQHFIRCSDKVYVDVQCSRAFWDRYLSVFDRLVVCARMRDALPDDAIDSMLLSSREEVVFIGMPDFVGATGPIKNYGKIKSVLVDSIKQVDAAIIRIPSPISMVAYPILDKSGIPWAAEMMMNPRTAYSKESMSHPLQPVIQRFITWQTKRACMNADGVSYVTDHVLQSEYPCRALAKSNKGDAFTSSYSTINLRNCDYSCVDWGTEIPSPLVLAHTGKMSDDRKGHAIFIETIAKLRRNGIDVRGILIGDGPERSRFEALSVQLGVRDCCNFVGWKAGFSQVQSELQRAQILLMPTKSEGLPRAVIEAMASGLICLGNNVDGMPELLPEECLSRENTADGYSRMIMDLVDDWPHALALRASQFEKSKEYKSELLNDRRNAFYRNLRDASLRRLKDA